ncbi:MAG: tail fiber protein [Planctomycetota bacterium]
MAEPFMAEIRMMSFNFAPKGWALCNGQLVSIQQNQALFSLLGTVYGGDGRVNFALPNLQGRVPIRMGNGHTLGEVGGQQTHTLLISEMPQHIHFANSVNVPSAAGNPSNARMVSQSGGANLYAAAPATNTMPGALAPSGGNQAHDNMQPYTVINFSIALQGIFPSQN